MNVLLALSQVEVTGAETYAVLLADALIRRGHTVLIVSDTLTRKTLATHIPLDLNNRTVPNRIRHIRRLARLIRENDIDVVHAHSRASSWVSCFAARICGIPLITTVHGRQPVHASRKIVKAFGDSTIAVCENIRDHLVSDLGLPPEDIEVIRNGIILRDAGGGRCVEPVRGPISIIGRLSGPKGDVTHTILRDIVPSLSGVAVRVIGGQTIPERFEQFRPAVDFLGYVDDVVPLIRESSVVIGAGQVAMQGLMCGVPTIAIGEACSVGLITMENFSTGLRSNFGDIATDGAFDWKTVASDIEAALAPRCVGQELRDIARREFDGERMVDAILSTYQDALAARHRREVPVLTYHRVVKSAWEAGNHGIYVTKDRFEKQLRYLKRKRYTVLTLREFMTLSPKQISSGRYAILTFDDGYEDNYTHALPLLRKYGFQAVVFLVTNCTVNQWDCDQPAEPAVPLLSIEQIRRMRSYGIEFGAHTLHHPHLTELSAEEAAREISGSREQLEEIVGERIASFCYPYGDLNEEVKMLVKQAGYSFGVASNSGPVNINQDRFEIRRIQVFPGTGMMGFRRKVSGRYLSRTLKRGSGG
ncbi:MAG: polysaccharide deacetylase [Chlorobi bacterium]|nr:polysaccharide deacetylase [Chlorobiota bacterium]